MHQGSESVGESAREDHHYPFAGTANPIVRLGVVPTSGGEVLWFDLTARFGPDIYLARVKWFYDGSLVLQIQNREQNKVELLRVVPKTGEVSTLFVEEMDAWVNLHNMLNPLKKQPAFLWASERTGGGRAEGGGDGGCLE